METLVLFIILLFCGSGCAQKDLSIEEFLTSVDGLSFEKIICDSSYLVCYKIMYEQPLDHNNPAGKKFKQRFYLSHINSDRSTVMITHGYEARQNNIREISRYLNANQIMVEHRFFGESVPDSMEWKYLTVEQSANDLHRINELFREFYKGKWITSGISKGGQTTIFYRKYFPDDVDVSVPYVAPLNLEKEDPKLYNYLDNVAGTPECRERIIAFQRNVLKHRKEILPMAKKYTDDSGFTFTYNDFETAFEYSVLEYRFSFWQWGGDCGQIPGNDATAKELFDHLVKVSSLALFGDRLMEYFAPFQYQASTEMGYYGFKIDAYKDLLISVKEDVGSELSFPYRDVELSFNPNTMKGVNDWVQYEGNNMIYIYGADDTWAACAVNVSPETNAVKIVKESGDHATRIRNLPEDQKELVFDRLEEWLDMKVNRNLQFPEGH